jgi:hypothetical protein
MSATAKFRKQLRLKKLLGYLEMANRNSQASHANQLISMQDAAAELDGGGQSLPDIRFLDIRTNYRNSLGPQMHHLQEKLAVETGRASVLKQHLEDTRNAINVLRTEIQLTSDTEQVLSRLNHKGGMITPASRKPTEQ